MFRRHGEPHYLAPARDLIEIVAILAAGFWAIYVFAYEQRIKPAGEPPSVLLSGSLHRLGERGDLVQLGINGTVRNVGHNAVSIVALGLSASGVRYTAKGTPVVTHPYPGSTVYQRDARAGTRALVYRLTELTALADVRSHSEITIEPGDDIPFSSIFLVKRGDFDSVMLYGSIAFTKVATAGAYPTNIGYNSDGAVLFSSASHAEDFDWLEITLDQITLW